jgi:hypothetical protein
MRDADSGEGGGNRVIRPLFTIASASSLLLCLATIILWVRSYRTRELLYFGRGTLCLHSSRGEISLEYYDSMPASNAWFVRVEMESWDDGWPLGFSGGVHDPNDAASPPHARFPYWSLVAVAALLPLAWIAAWVRNNLRISQARCPSCGYDLRASNDRCPECGMLIPQKAQA